METYTLEHCGNSIMIYNLNYSDLDAKAGNPYNTTLDIKVVSGLFSGVCNCEYDMSELVIFAREVNEMYEFRRQEVRFNDICYGSWINFEMNKIGHLFIKGEIYGTGMTHVLKFEFYADQSSLKHFADSLKRLVTDET